MLNETEIIIQSNEFSHSNKKKLETGANLVIDKLYAGSSPICWLHSWESPFYESLVALITQQLIIWNVPQCGFNKTRHTSLLWWFKSYTDVYCNRKMQRLYACTDTSFTQFWVSWYCLQFKTIVLLGYNCFLTFLSPINLQTVLYRSLLKVFTLAIFKFERILVFLWHYSHFFLRGEL